MATLVATELRGALSQQDQSALANCRERFLSAQATERSATMEMAKAIHDAHEVLASHDGGTFEKWVRDELQITPQHARRLLQAWQVFGGANIDVRTFDRTALLTLASDTIPESALQCCVDFSDAGQHVTAGMAKAAIAVASNCPDDDEALADLCERVKSGAKAGKRLAEVVSNDHGWQPEKPKQSEPRLLPNDIAHVRETIEQLADDWPQESIGVLISVLSDIALELKDRQQ